MESGARHAFLDAACHDAPELKYMVKQLLREDERAGSFLKKPLFDLSVDITASGVDGTDRTVRRSPRFKEGEVIARRFSVIRLIARGGMGEVYEVEDHLLQCSRVASKIVRPEIAADPEASHRFMQEVLLARQVSHPNLCPIYEIFRCDEAPPAFLFLTMKLLAGDTLDAYIRKGLLISRDEALEIFRQMRSRPLPFTAMRVPPSVR